MIIASDNLLALGLFILPTYQVCVFLQAKIELLRVYVVYRILLQLCLCLHMYILLSNGVEGESRRGE